MASALLPKASWHGLSDSAQCGQSGHMRMPYSGASRARTCTEKANVAASGSCANIRRRRSYPGTSTSNRSVGLASRLGASWPIHRRCWSRHRPSLTTYGSWARYRDRRMAK